MKCPKCKHDRSVEHFDSAEQKSYRQCLGCGNRYTEEEGKTEEEKP